jgi:predicted O-linked N-acetylglucosamine transferase (SPINDLY family)
MHSRAPAFFHLPSHHPDRKTTPTTNPQRIHQVSYMGFCGSMGADFIQFLIADPTVIPPAARPYYSERVIYMPHSYFVNVRA